MTPALRPSDGDALRAVLREVTGSSGLPIAFAGEVAPRRTPDERDSVVISELLGTRTVHLRGLAVVAGAGLGGRVLTEGRPHAVEDYGRARGITHDYDGPVLAEGLCTVVATPVLVGGRPRAVVYAAAREPGSVGARVRDSLTRAAGRMAAELGVRDEVDRRVAMLQAATVSTRTAGPDAAGWEELRAVHSDLRVIAADLTDEALRERVHAACSRLAALGALGALGAGTAGTDVPPVRLSVRETDVLAQVALGCSNAETARRLSVRPETVKSYLAVAMGKLDARTRHEAVVRARSLGLLP